MLTRCKKRFVLFFGCWMLPEKFSDYWKKAFPD